MPIKVREIYPPTGLSRLAFRIPIWFYQAGMGRLLGGRFLELTHIGRKSGLIRHTVLEVVRHDKESGTYFIAVGFGEHSDWYQNILADPHVEIRSGVEHIQAIAIPLTEDEAGDELVRYAHRYPLAFRELLRFMGYKVDGSDEDIHALGGYIHMFALKPTGWPDVQVNRERE
jgi:deazaflavin-dependent oxidoreductase (nitroreductase family)